MYLCVSTVVAIVVVGGCVSLYVNSLEMLSFSLAECFCTDNL